MASVLADARTGPARALEIVGPAGIGKTALVETALAELADGDWRVIRLGFTEAERQIAWSGLSSLWPQLDAAEVPIADGLAVSAALGGTVDGDDVEAASGLPAAVAGAVRSALGAVVAASPTVLVVDDVAWADAASAAVITAAVRGRLGDRFAVLTTARPAPSSVIDLARMFGDRHTVLTLPPLGHAEVLRILRSHVSDVTPAMVDGVAGLAGGNPLHTRLVAEMIARGGWQPGRLPESILAAFGSDLERVGREVEEILAAAGLHGQIDLALLGAAFGPERVENAMGVAESSGLIGAAADARPEGLAFAHPMIAAAAVERAGVMGRRSLHRRLAAALPTGHEMHAVHLAETTDAPDAAIADVVEAAGANALERGDRHVAGVRFRRAETLTPEDAAADRWRRQLRAADAFLHAGDLGAAGPLAQRAFDESTALDQRALAGGLCVQVRASRGDMTETQRFARELLLELDPVPMLKGFLGRAGVRIDQVFDLHQALATAQRLRAEMAAAGLADLANEFAVLEAGCRYLVGESVDVWANWRLVRDHLDPTDTIGAGWFGFEMLVWSELDPELVHELLDRFVDTCRAAGAMQALAKATEYRGIVLLRSGRLADAADAAARALDIAELSEVTGSMASTTVAAALAPMGRLDEARRVLMRGPTASATDAVPMLRFAHQVALGQIESCAGNWEAAASELSAAWATAEKFGYEDVTAMWFRADLVDALAQVGSVSSALERAAVIEALATRSGRAGGLAQADRALATAHLAAGEVRQAVDAGRRGIARYAHVRMPLELARTQLVTGAALRRAGQRAEAATVLRDALSSFEACGAVVHARRAAQELDRLGAVRGSGNELTASEREVVAHVRAGRSNVEIAREMVVSVRTVESHLTRIYRKLGVRSRTQLVTRPDD